MRSFSTFFAGCMALLFMVNLSACLNFKNYGKTPNSAESYPEFDERDALRGAISSQRAGFDVQFYDLDIEFDMKNKSISGEVEMHFVANRNLDTIQIDLYDNLIIDEITMQGNALEYSRKYNTVWVYLESSISTDAQEIISVKYHGKPDKAKRAPWDGGFVWKKDKEKNPWVGVACEEIGASLWWPLKDHLHDEPDSVALHFTVPQDLYCVSNGRLVGEEHKGSKRTFHWQTSYPINSYNVTFYIGDFQFFDTKFHSEYQDFQLDYYVLKENLDLAKEHFKQVPDVLEFFEETFGPYPWPKDGFKLVESPYEGMEHQSAIAYGNGYKNDVLFGFDYIIVHEAAHEWWGNSVSASDYADIWLHEGFATYAEALYVEHTLGYDAYLSYVDFYGLLINNKKPVIGPRDVNFWDYKDSDPYLKGCLTLHNLRNTLHNDSLFFDIIKSFYQENAYSVIETQDFVNHVNAKANEDLSWLFNQFLYDRRAPVLKWRTNYDPRSSIYNYKVNWENCRSDFKMPIEVYDAYEGKSYFIEVTTEIQLFQSYSYPYFSDSDRSYFYLELEE